MGAVPPFLPAQCPLLGVKRTSRGLVAMSAFDPSATFDQELQDHRAKPDQHGLSLPVCIEITMLYCSALNEIMRIKVAGRFLGEPDKIAILHVCRL
jgi:hypothetical protein